MVGVRKIIPVGTVFGRLTKTGDAGLVGYGTQGHRVAMSHCKCVCGNEITVRNDNLRSKNTMSCGCFRIELLTARLTTHGQSRIGKKTPEYMTWCEIIKRTTNPNHKHWSDYGGRGGVVCERWLKFENFYEDMGDKPSSQHSIDRIDNAGHYSPENCRWATRIEQANNRRSNRKLTYDGVTKNMGEWAKDMGVSPATIHKRLGRGWSVEKAFSTPIRRTK